MSTQAHSQASAAPTALHRIYPSWTGTIRSVSEMQVVKAGFRSRGWRPPKPDDSLPDPESDDYATTMEMYARRLFDAMNTHDPESIQDRINDPGKRGNRIVKAGYDQTWVECQAWELLVAAVDLHNNGSTLLVDVDISTREDKTLSFADRITAMEHTLREWKAACDDVCGGNKILQVVHGPKSSWMRKANNKRNNDSKKVIIDAGKRASNPTPQPDSASSRFIATPTLTSRGAHTSARAPGKRTLSTGAIVRSKRVSKRGKHTGVRTKSSNPHPMTPQQKTVFDVALALAGRDDGEGDNVGNEDD